MVTCVVVPAIPIVIGAKINVLIIVKEIGLIQVNLFQFLNVVRLMEFHVLIIRLGAALVNSIANQVATDHG